MYYDDFEQPPDRRHCGYNELTQVRPRWSRLLGAVLFGLLAVLHACS